YAALMPIMNTAYGPPEQLPFDMGHLRHPIQYHLAPTAKNAERRAARNALSLEIEKKLRLQIVATQPSPPPPRPFPKAEPKDGPGRFRAVGEPIGRPLDASPFGIARQHNIALAPGPVF